MQLVLNMIWSFLFFGMQSPFLGLIDIILLWFTILATIVMFYSISKKAAYLLIPYILWVSFAAVLNFSVWLLNPL
jgi:tryptophan-rich sensory protein